MEDHSERQHHTSFKDPEVDFRRPPPRCGRLEDLDGSKYVPHHNEAHEDVQSVSDDRDFAVVTILGWHVSGLLSILEKRHNEEVSGVWCELEKQ